MKFGVLVLLAISLSTNAYASMPHIQNPTAVVSRHNVGPTVIIRQRRAVVSRHAVGPTVIIRDYYASRSGRAMASRHAVGAYSSRLGFHMIAPRGHYVVPNLNAK